MEVGKGRVSNFIRTWASSRAENLASKVTNGTVNKREAI